MSHILLLEYARILDHPYFPFSFRIESKLLHDTIKISQSLWILNFDMNSTHPQTLLQENSLSLIKGLLTTIPKKNPHTVFRSQKVIGPRLYQHKKDVTQRLHDRLEGRRMPWRVGKGAKRDREVHGTFISRMLFSWVNFKGWLQKKKWEGSNRSFPKGETSQDNNVTMATVTTVTTATRRKKKTKNNKKEEEEDEV